MCKYKLVVSYFKDSLVIIVIIICYVRAHVEYVFSVNGLCSSISNIMTGLKEPLFQLYCEYYYGQLNELKKKHKHTHKRRKSCLTLISIENIKDALSRGEFQGAEEEV